MLSLVISRANLVALSCSESHLIYPAHYPQLLTYLVTSWWLIFALKPLFCVALWLPFDLNQTSLDFHYCQVQFLSPYCPLFWVQENWFTANSLPPLLCSKFIFALFFFLYESLLPHLWDTATLSVSGWEASVHALTAEVCWVSLPVPSYHEQARKSWAWRNWVGHRLLQKVS